MKHFCVEVEKKRDLFENDISNSFNLYFDLPSYKVSDCVCVSCCNSDLIFKLIKKREKKNIYIFSKTRNS